MFPQRLDPLAYDIAKAMMDGFNRHYRLFRTESARAKHRFETQTGTASSARSASASSSMTCA
jgi:isocitrate dehydrogenase kinase/phosphatase